MHQSVFSLSATVTLRECNSTFRLTIVYEPSQSNTKRAFLQEIASLKPPPGIRWLVLGDFNLIRQAADKNNSNINPTLMAHFQSTLNSCELKEIHLQNRKFTWSNERLRPTLVRLDRVFCNTGWDTLFENHVLQALSSSISDHCPLLLSNTSGPGRPKTFRFESFWTKMPGFLETLPLSPHVSFAPLNTANIVLIPKKEGADRVQDYRPISLIHGLGKWIAKTLALQVAPFLDNLVSQAQSAFIKMRSIHDNFLFVRNLVRRLHCSRTPTLFLKLDIAKAFDSVRWDYLLDLLQKRGFPLRWTNWIVALLNSASSRVLLNGIPGKVITHGRGLRQGDPLSPFLFILAIDPIQRLLEVATDTGALARMQDRFARLKTSIYADDAAIFINPSASEIHITSQILSNFGMVSGLHTNFLKSKVLPISCDHLDLNSVLQDFPAIRSTFPIKYLGLPLTYKRLHRVDY
uniref:PH01B001G05.21 protein n=1 Tax=Phyllostachys edulis TaxID=38705 RepID=L0P3N4_PHYED|nr:PH01B001G05.21 [Phyllostachys edulis]